MLLECVDDSLVGKLGLGVAWSEVVELDPPFLAQVLELKADELRAIVSDYLLWYAEVANDILPYELFDFSVADLMEGLSFYPLSEVIGHCEHVYPLARGRWEFVDDVYPPFHEWPRGDDGSELLKWKMCYLCEALETVALLDKGDGVRPHGRLIVASS